MKHGGSGGGGGVVMEGRQESKGRQEREFQIKAGEEGSGRLPSLPPWLSTAGRQAVGRGPPPPSVGKSSWGPANTTAAARPPSWPPGARAMGETLRRSFLDETPQKERQGGKRDGGNRGARLTTASHDSNKQSKREVLGAAALYRPNGRLKVTPPKCPEDGPYTV